MPSRGGSGLSSAGDPKEYVATPDHDDREKYFRIIRRSGETD
jgi:hypothetical protein